jgi:hypothetical protein
MGIKHALSMVGKQKPIVGMDRHNSRFTDDQIREIRRRRANGEKSLHLAKEFGTNYQYIWLITTRRVWKHVI